jgi:hypothetical protein
LIDSLSFLANAPLAHDVWQMVCQKRVARSGFAARISRSRAFEPSVEPVH